MKHSAIVGAFVAMVATTAFADGAAVFADGAAVQTLALHNVHIRVSDPATAGEWYVKCLGATAGRAPQLIYFGKTLVEFIKTDNPQPSAGSVIDHIGLSYADLSARMKDFEAGGAKIVTPVRDNPGLFKLGFIEDPWGTKIEVVEDSELLGFHHVHLRVPDPSATLTWYSDMLGGDRGKLKGRIDGLRYGTVWLLAASSGKDTVAPSLDRAIQNVAFLVPNVDDAVAVLKTKGVKTRIEPRSIGSVRYAFVEDPNGVQIELIHQQQ
jgi:catechol 2,3-dioxygenase-like lactoylglutathione lyase family enzyme